MKTITYSFTTLNHLNFSHFITLFCAILSFFCPENIENIISSLGILTFGIIHGANDLKILAKKDRPSKYFLNIPLWIIYLVIVFMGIFIFYFIPGIALFSFVVVSCYHFGEQHWQECVKSSKKTPIFYSAYGTLIFSMLFIFHLNEVKQVIYQIASVNLTDELFLGILILSSIITLLFIIKNIKDIKHVVIECLLLGFLALIFFKSSLLFGFGFYFVVWHSLPSLSSQIKYLYEEQEINRYSKYFKDAFLYWVLALVGLVGFYLLGVLPKDQYLPVFFSFLAAITFPHVVVMGLMFYSFKSYS